MVAVSTYTLQLEFFNKETEQALILVDPPFQLTGETKPRTFKKEVLFKIAQCYIEHEQMLRSRGKFAPDVDEVRQWLNSPLFVTEGGGVTIAGFGGSASGGSSPNTSSGFSEEGFIAMVSDWLSKTFPKAKDGAFVCVIDNLELLNTSRAARELIEALRDDVLNLRGLKWVLCGARGIARSVASSQRLQGVISEPLDVSPVANKYIEPLIAARLESFATSGETLVPVEARGFNHLYLVGNSNLRNAMKYSEDFSMWLFDRASKDLSSDDKYELLEIWMSEVADKAAADTKDVKPRAWTVFDQLAKAGGFTSPGEFADYGFESNQAMRPHLRSLEEAKLIDSEVDETDNRRKTISVTSRGWIVSYQRSGYRHLAGAR